MKVWSFGEHSGPIIDFVTLETDDRLKNKFIDPSIGPVFGSLIVNYFKDRSYGVGVEEIFYREYCLMPEHKFHIQEYFNYRKKRKLINCVVELDYELSLELAIPEFAKYIASKFIERSEDFFKLEIPDFDCASYMNDLKLFFSQKDLI